MKWQLRERSLDLSVPRVMGILNITPDSFSDGGNYLDPHRALERAVQIQGEGADVIDIGAESTRPGAVPVSISEEWSRLEAVLKKLVGKIHLPISVDTRNSEVARRALEYGVEIINDISGGRDPQMLKVVAEAGCGYVLMHMRGEPNNMMEFARYRDVTEEVQKELTESVEQAVSAGISPEKICVDPGFGFAKEVGDSLNLFLHLEIFRRWNFPLLVGLSRKRLLRAIAGEEPQALQAASVAAALWAVGKGAHIVRVHDVAPTVAVLQSYGLLTKGGESPIDSPVDLT